MAAEAVRLRTAAARGLTSPVPTCPGWTVEDLVRHVANLYLNVVVRRLRMPADTPKQDLAEEDPLAAFDRGYAAMMDEFSARRPEDHVGQLPHETVRYWVRRMVHETAIHRLDAELAFTEAVSPIPSDQAIDGVDEMLTGFLGELTRLFPEEFAADLSDWADRWALVSAGDAAWRITVRPDSAEVTRIEGHGVDGGAAARISGKPAAMLRSLYNRGGAGEVTTDGNGALIAQLRRLLTAVTNTT
nr:maleylpyruvate isomerase N-terminal domain-containing protein [Planosporangium thailandense]